ncbi:MAG: hypothetical protein ACI8P9_003531 [Parasphingorhabdus sp.]|jgi:hypothetical protein
MKKLSQIAKRVSGAKRKRQSKFEKLWTRVENLQSENSRLRVELSGLVEELNKKILPAERILGVLQRELALKLIDFQRYKSLTSHERRNMRIWVGDICQNLNFTEHYDEELREAIARDVARDLDLELDPKRNAEEQVDTHFEAMDEFDLEQEKQEVDDWIKSEVDRRVAEMFGNVNTVEDHVLDMFQDQFAAEEDRRSEKIRTFREAVEAELRAMYDPGFDEPEWQPGIDSPFSEFEYSDETTTYQNNEPTGRLLTSDVFKRLFRKTAHALHPDRETNEDKRQEKQNLMKTLLEARNNGDLLTVFKLHQQFVGEDAELNASDEKQLAKVLEFRVKTLEAEKQAITSESPQHRMAFDVFYSKSKKARDRKIAKHIRGIEDDRAAVKLLLNSMVNLKTLRAALNNRREAALSLFEFDNFDFEFSDNDWFRK